MRFCSFSKLLSLIFLCFIFHSVVSAQEYGRIRGFVTDSTNGEALAFGNVFIKGADLGASTNERGLFIINQIPLKQPYEVTFSYVGYKTKTISIKLENSELVQVNAALSPLSIELQAIEKIGEKVIDKNSTDIGLERISIKQLEYMPKGVETDVMRSLQTVAGVRSTGDVSARYYVRGGTSDQNLVLLNGITIYNPFHSLGLFSVIDPDMINSVEFFKGGFTSEYGGRISSVLNIVSKDGNKKSFGAKGSASFLTTKTLIEGPIPNGSFVISGRKSYSNDILKKFLNDQVVPIDFYDVSFKLNYSSPDLWENGKFVLFGFLSNDNLDYEDPLKENFKWSSSLFGFEWLQVYDVPLYSRIALSYSKFDGEVIPNFSSLKPKKNEVNDLNFSIDFNLVNENKNELGLGLIFKGLTAKLFSINEQGAETNIDQFSGNFSVYAKYKFLQYENLGIDIGSRMNLTGLSKSGEFTPEPRISATYRLFPFLRLKAAWGLYIQEVATVSDEDEIISIFEPWIIIPDYLDITKATNYTGGFELDLSDYSTFGVEGYYKIIKNLPIINREKSLSHEPDLVSGKGESYGWEFNFNMVSGSVNFKSSYTLSWAYREIDDYIYYPKYDSRHAVNLSFDYNFGWGVTASVAWNYSSGLPFTELIGYYDKYYLQDPFNPNLERGNFNPFLILGGKNLGRLPSYHRLDLSVSKQLIIYGINLTMDISAINVYNRENIFYYERDTGERVNMLPFLLTATAKVEI